MNFRQMILNLSINNNPKAKYKMNNIEISKHDMLQFIKTKNRLGCIEKIKNAVT